MKEKYLFPVFRIALLTLVCVLFISSFAQAQTVLVNYAFNDATAGTPCLPGTSNAATGVTPTFTTSTGSCTTPGGTATTASAFVPNVTGPSVSITGFATGNTQFFQFQLAGVSTFQNYQVYLQTQRSGTGPVTGDLQYSTNGSAFTSFQTVSVPDGTFTGGAFNFDLSTISAIEGQPTVYFRFVGSGGSNSAGTFRIDNFQVRAFGITAAPASINGRVTTSTGRGISKAYLTLSGGDLKEPVVVLTNPFGYYRFENVPTGQSYIVSVYSKRHTFENPTRVFSHGDELFGVDFTASP